MSHEVFYLVSDSVRDNLLNHLMGLPVDGTLKVVISKSGSKSDKQRGLQWRWYTDVSKAGIGGEHEETKEGVHLISKYRWAVPILCRDDEFFASLYSQVASQYGDNPAAMKWFVENHVSTEDFNVSQMAEYLTAFFNYYAPLCALTDPDDKGLLYG